MAKELKDAAWYGYVAVGIAVISLLSGIASFQAGKFSSLMLDEKNNSILFQNKANKEWNNYLALDINRRAQGGRVSAEQEEFKMRAENFEKEVTASSEKFQKYFARNGHLTTAGTILEISVVLLSTNILIKKKFFWILSLAVAAVGGYFLLLGVI